MFENLGDRLQSAVNKIKGYGKITEDNIFELKELFPDDNIGVDVSSSLEINNCKSPEKIRSFLKKSKGI